MGTDLTIIEPIKPPGNPARLPSWPAWLQQRSGAVENVAQADPNHNGSHRLMLTLPANLILNAAERRMVEAHRTELARFLDLDQPFELREKMLTNDQAHGVMIAGLLIKGGGIKLDQQSSDQLTEDYLDAIEDLPAWSVREALRKWNRAESPRIDPKQPHNFVFRPAPPTLRQLAYLDLWTVKSRIQDLEKMLNAVPRIEYSDEHRGEMLMKLQALVANWTVQPMSQNPASNDAGKRDDQPAEPPANMPAEEAAES